MRHLVQFKNIYKKFILGYALILFFSFPPTSYSQPWTDLQQLGETTVSHFFWKVYDAKLYSSDNNFSLERTRPFALEIIYARPIAKSILIRETHKQWLEMKIIDEPTMEIMIEALDRVLISVDEGDAITLYVNENGQSHFYLNDKEIGIIEDTLFTVTFASIWLSERTSRPNSLLDLIASPLNQ